MKFRIIDTTDNKNLGKDFEVNSLNELKGILGESFDEITVKGGNVKLTNSNYTVKLKRID